MDPGDRRRVRLRGDPAPRGLTATEPSHAPRRPPRTAQPGTTASPQIRASRRLLEPMSALLHVRPQHGEEAGDERHFLRRTDGQHRAHPARDVPSDSRAGTPDYHQQVVDGLCALNCTGSGTSAPPSSSRIRDVEDRVGSRRPCPTSCPLVATDSRQRFPLRLEGARERSAIGTCEPDDEGRAAPGVGGLAGRSQYGQQLCALAAHLSPEPRGR